MTAKEVFIRRHHHHHQRKTQRKTATSGDTTYSGHPLTGHNGSKASPPDFSPSLPLDSSS